VFFFAPYPAINHQLLYLWPEPRMKTGAASVSQQLGLLLQQEVNFRDSRQENMGKLVQRLFNQFQHSPYNHDGGRGCSCWTLSKVVNPLFRLVGQKYDWNM
jgi:hypothetical protein